MVTEIFIPKMGANIDKAIVGEIKVKEGDTVKKGDILFEIVTDKATFEVEADSSGVVVELTTNQGDELDVLTVVGKISDEDDVRVTSTKVQTFTPETTNKSQKLSKPEVHNELVTPAKPVKATPKARKLAKDNNIEIEKEFVDFTQIVTEEDVQKLIMLKEKEVKEDGEKENLKEEKDFEIIKITPRKAAEIQALSQSQQNLYSSVTMQFSTAKIKEVVNAFANKHDIRLSINQYIYFCVASCLKDFPDINAVYTQEGLKRYNNVHLGIAMNSENGLVVPVIKHAEKLSLLDFLLQFNELVFRLIKNELTATDMKDGTFTITDLSAYHLYNFVPIMNRNQSSILAISSEYDSCTFVNGKLEYDPKMNVTLAFDHRVLDGKYAAEFLQKLYASVTN